MTGGGSAGTKGGSAHAPPGRRWAVVAMVLRSRARSWRQAARVRVVRGTRATAAARRSGPAAGAAPPVRFQVLPGGQAGAYRLLGETDIAARQVLHTELVAATRGTGDVRLDLAGLTFIDVGGAAELVSAALHLGPGRRLILDHASPMLCRIIELAWGPVPGLEVNPR